MALQECGLNMNNTKKELQIHGTAAFPCAGYISSHSDFPDDIIPWHWHEEMEVIYVEKGILILKVLSDTMQVKAGEMAVLNANILHSGSGAPNCELQSMVYSSSLISSGEGSSMEEKYIKPLTDCCDFSVILLSPETDGKLIECYKKSFENLRSDSLFYEFSVRDALTKIVMEVYRRIEPKAALDTSNKNTDSLRLSYMLDFVHENYFDKLSLKEIADSAGIGSREALRCFKRTIGESPVQYLLKYRLMQSANALVYRPEESIARISADCGFDSPAYYSKKFRELYSCTPNEYRKRNQLI